MERLGTLLIGKYELGRLLGQGTFAKVYYARNIETGQSVAVKVFNKEKIIQVNLMERTIIEITAMRMVKHPNIVELYEVIATKNKIYFILEYVKGGELFDMVRKGKLPENAARKYFQQLVSAVEYCHSRGVCHRDLKLENLLLDDYGNLKVSDFGLSALINRGKNGELLHTTCGTPAYVAPEVISRVEYCGAKSDIWSCGVILYVLLAGYYPFHDSCLLDMYNKIKNAEFKCPNWFPAHVRRLLARMMDPNPGSRISITGIKDNKWFRDELNNKNLGRQAEVNKLVSKDVSETFNSRGHSSYEKKHEPTSIKHMNAFGIISLSAGLDLSKVFEGISIKREAWFTTSKPTSEIISKLEKMAKSLKMKVKKKESGVVQMEGLKKGRKGILAVKAEIFEFAPSVHLVELKKSNGDTLEYQKLLKEDIRPALKDIVWAWQGE